LLVLVLVVAGALYSVPNLYGEDPALQVSPTRTTKVDNAILARVEDLLKQDALSYKSIVLDTHGLLVRFADTETQLKAKDKVKTALGNDYVVALNLAPSTPGWLTAIKALPMYLGLDLRGGVHFLMEVDMGAAVKQSEERYAGDLRTLFRDKKLRYVTITRTNKGVEIKFRTREERDQARDAAHKEYDSLVLREEDSGNDYYLYASLSEADQREVRKLALQQNITTLRNRVNELGVSEPVIQQQGQDRVVVQLPGVQDTARAKEILGATATLEFRMVDEGHSVEDAVAGRVPAGARLYKKREGGQVLLKNQVILTGDYITDAASGIEQRNGSPAVFITLDGKGAAMFSNATKENVGKAMGVVFIENKTETRTVDGKQEKVRSKVEEVINVAVIQEQLGKRFQITGLDSTTEARNLALLLRAGALAAPLEIVEERTVGPSLGAENITKGFDSTLIGFAAIALFMTVYYYFFGVIASIALAVNVLLLIAVLSLLQATLTLPGIAGIALTVGMAIDANVLIFERIREELRNGNSPQASIHAGYDRAFDTIVDSNITTLIAGFALFMLGSGPVRGFAVTLCIGILTSMFSAVMVSRAVVNLLYGGRRKLAKLSI
ncbi:MAG TPA: protein translocase subunit SecD, partial [Gammaproteobacteria bacterium]|nr:protein translocase subunit SecD [Gammaproteobacteria bacterium]